MNLKLDNIPQELKTTALFCTWRLTEKGKEPFNPVTGYRARSNQKNTFHNYTTIMQYLPEYLGFNKEGQVTGGLGLGIFNGFSAIDIDNCIDENGLFSDLAKDIIDYMKSYTEISPSGRGVRIIFKTNTNLDKNIYYINNKNNGLEIYISDNTNKYVTLTGNSINVNENINEIDIKVILDKYMKKPVNNMAVRPAVTAPAISIDDIDNRININLSNNPRFNEAWHKTATGSGGTESEDDMSFLNMLARILDGDAAAIQAAFERSPYYATKDSAHVKKWEQREDYRVTSIQKAITYYHSLRMSESESFAFNDSGNARLFVNAFSDKIKYNIDNKVWTIWNGNYWEVDRFGRIKLFAETVIEQMRIQALNETSIEIKKKMNSNINRVLNTHGKDAMIKEAQHLDNIPTSNNMFDIDKYSINTKSGIIDLRTGDIIPPDKNLMHSKYIDVAISNETPHVWLRFLQEIYADNPDLVGYVQRLAGYWLTGLTSEQSLYIFLGDGSNGKSLFLETLLKIMGNYGSTTSSDLLVDNRYSGGNAEQRLATLIGARFVMVEETESNDRLKESTIKNLTSDYGEITARFLYGNEFSFKPVFKLIMATNHKPIIRGTDHGIWRRIKIIPHNIIIPDNKQDKMLGVKLAKELPQILGWAVAGAVEYFKNGLQEPVVISDQVAEYRSDMNIIERWIIDNCEKDPNYSESSAVLYRNFVEYTKENNEYTLTQNMFSTNLGKKFERARLRNARSFKGIRLRTKDIIEKMDEIVIKTEDI